MPPPHPALLLAGGGCCDGEEGRPSWLRGMCSLSTSAGVSGGGSNPRCLGIGGNHLSWVWLLNHWL